PNPVKVFDVSGNPLLSFSPYGTTYNGGVRVAAGNLVGDSRAEIVTAADSGVSAIRAFDQAGAQLWSTQAYKKPGGNFIAVGDGDGDRRNESIPGPEGRNQPYVQVYHGSDGTAVTGKINAYATDFFSGVRVAVLDVNGDGKMDVLVTTRGGRTVKVYDWLTKKKIDSFFAFESTFKYGLFVAGG